MEEQRFLIPYEEMAEFEVDLWNENGYPEHIFCNFCRTYQFQLLLFLVNKPGLMPPRSQVRSYQPVFSCEPTPRGVASSHGGLFGLSPRPARVESRLPAFTDSDQIRRPWITPASVVGGPEVR
jgi:hypothetical protein